MKRKRPPQHSEPSAGNEEPSLGNTKHPRTEEEFLSEVRLNMDVDADDELEGPRAMAEKSKRKGSSQ
jgi:hypothetical protein